MAVPDNILVHSMEVLLAASSHHDRPQQSDRRQDTVTRESHTTTPTTNSLDDVVQAACTLSETRQHVTMTELPSVTSGGESGSTITTMQLTSGSGAHTMANAPSSVPQISEHAICITDISHTVLSSSSTHVTTHAALGCRTHLAPSEATSTVNSVSQCRESSGNGTPMVNSRTAASHMKSHNSPSSEISRGQLTLMEHLSGGEINKGMSVTVGKSLEDGMEETCQEGNARGSRTVECQTMSWEEIVAMVTGQNGSKGSESEKMNDRKQDPNNALSGVDIDINSSTHDTANICTNQDHCNSNAATDHMSNKDKEVTQYYCKHCNNHFHLCQHVYSFIEKSREVTPQRSRKGKKKKAKKHMLEDWPVTICKVEKNTTGRFACKICDKSFTKSSHLKSHQITHTGAKPFKCKHCNKSYTQKSSLNIHARIHTGEVWFRCDQCRKYFRTQESLEKHMAGHMEKKPFDCPQCKADFKTIEALERHLVKHGEDEQPRLCEHCGKHFANKKTLRQHIKFMHTEVGLSEKEGAKQEPPGLKCDLCDKMFRSKYHLISHRITHTNSRPFACDECEKTYRTPSALRGHKKAVHAGIKDHVCSVCQMGFPTPAQLRNHQTRHTGERPHKCTYCKAAFRHANSLRFHIRKHTGEKPHICPHCGRSFRFPGNLKAHIMTHTKERPWQCDLCGKSFARQATLVDHKKSHTGEKNCICMYCGKAYRLRGHLRYHMKSHMKKLDQEFGTSATIPTAIMGIDHAKKHDPSYGATATVSIPIKMDQNYGMAPPTLQAMPVPVTLHSVPQHPIRLPYTYQ